MTPKTKYLTAVFQITNMETFRLEAGSITSAMCNISGIPGANVTVAGWVDLMTERDNLAEFVDGLGYNSDEIARGDV